MTKQPSAELASMIKTAAENLISFGELWTSIKKKGADEGFQEKELQDILRPLLRDKLTANQIRYLFNREELKQKQQVRDQDRRKIAAIAVKKPLEQSDSYEEQLTKTENAPVTNIIDNKKPVEQIVAKGAEEDEMDLPPEMQAIAAKQIEPTNPLDIVVVGRYGLFDAKKTTEVLVRDLGKLKSSGWKVIEITARHIS